MDVAVAVGVGVNVARCCRCWRRASGRSCRRTRAGCRRWAWRAAAHWRLDRNRHGRACLKEADRRIGGLRRLIGIEPEVIQRAEANRVGVLILRKSFRAPGDRACVLGNIPRRAAITLVVEGAIICPAGLLTRRVKPDVRDVYSWSKRHAERLDRAIEVLVVERVFIVPDAS